MLWRLRAAVLPPVSRLRGFRRAVVLPGRKPLSSLESYFHRNKDVFLWELMIRNANDNMDRLHCLRVNAHDNLDGLHPLSPSDHSFGKDAALDIRVRADKDIGVITITDSGIGMTREELLRMIDHNYHSEERPPVWLEKLDLEMYTNLMRTEIMYYSALLVAEKVAISTKSPLSAKQYVWECEKGEEGCIRRPCEIREESDPEKLLPRGTRITLYLQNNDKGFAHPEWIQNLVKKYSQFVSFPIYTWQEKGHTKEVEVDEDPSKAKKDGEDQTEKKEKKTKQVVCQIVFPSREEAAGMRYLINGGIISYLKLENRSYIGHLGTIIGQKSNFHGCALRKESECEAPELPSKSDLKKIRRSLKVICDQSSKLRPKLYKHSYKNWQEQRRDRLTSSTFSSAVGFWPGRRFQLWLERIGAIKPFAGNLATMWNNNHEMEAIRDYVLFKEDVDMYFSLNIVNYPEDDWLAASPDRLVDDHGSLGILEIKCPYSNGYKTKDLIPWSRVPLYCIPQAQGLMEILDMEWLELHCWTLKGSSLFRIKRNKTYWSDLRNALSDFWFQHVEPGRDLWRHLHPSGELPLEEENDKDPLYRVLGQFPKSLLPAPRHELCSNLIISSRKIANESVLLGRIIRKIEPKNEF